MSEPGNSQKADKSYVLITAAYNEEVLIRGVINSVVSQTMRPKKWVIVSDCSTDRTNEIVRTYADQYEFIQLLQTRERHPRNFAAQVNALNAGYDHLNDVDYRFIGNLDADISFDPSYYTRLLEKFDGDLSLGLAGGFIYEELRGKFRIRRGNRLWSVPHAVQMFRRECYESIGGYVPLKYGGPDWYAEVSARMKGWRVEAFPEIKVYHHRHTGTANGFMRGRFRQGRMDFSLGSHPLFEIVKCIRRFPERPLIIGALSRLAGFVWPYFRREKRLVSEEFITFLRREQEERLWSSLIRKANSPE